MQPDTARLTDQIIEAHRRRHFVMDVRKMVDLKIGALLRTQMGWRKIDDDWPAKQKKEQAARNETAKERAAALMEIGEAEFVAFTLQAKQAALEADGGKLTAFERRRLNAARAKATTDEPAYAAWRETILASMQAREPFDAIEAAQTAEMERLAEQLPVWSWVKGIKGFGARSLAVIVAEAGDLSNYATHSKLWKRMGLAVIGDLRQGGLDKKTASKRDWIDHGYSPARRSRMFVVGDVLVKVGDTYRAIYLQRKEHERQKAEAAGLTIVPAAKIPKGRRAEFMSDGHIHRRAQRYMEKRLLRDLWKAWRRANRTVAERPTTALPAANEHRDAA